NVPSTSNRIAPQTQEPLWIVIASVELLSKCNNSVVRKLFVLILLFPLLAHADGDTDMARQRFNEGVHFFDRGEYDKARGAFLQAWALKRHPAVLLNLAQSSLRSHHEAEAARYFEEYLR